MNLSKLVINELAAALASERTFDPFSFPENIALKDEQRVEPLLSTFSAGVLVHVYQVCDGENKRYLYSAHGDGGVLCDFGGPFVSLEDAKEHFANVDEGWTEY